nr:acyl carrier protein 1, chloroplastic [Quercus suber]
MQPARFRISCVAKPETVTTVCQIVKKQLALLDDSAVTGESKFAALGADSLNMGKTFEDLHQNSLASHTPKDMNPQSSILLMEEMEVPWNT